jgi:hypothetical protein
MVDSDKNANLNFETGYAKSIPITHPRTAAKIIVSAIGMPKCLYSSAEPYAPMPKKADVANDICPLYPYSISNPVVAIIYISAKHKSIIPYG